jgi:hypothetical protein
MKLAGKMQNFSSIAMAFTMVAAFLLLAGGAKLAFVRPTRTRGILMIVAAAVLIMNVTIWTV